MVSQTSIFWQVVRLLAMILAAITVFKSKHASASAVTKPRNETDRLALLEFRHQIINDPESVLDSWNESKHHCKWQGVTCDARHQRVIALRLQGKGLSGTLSPHIGNLSFVKSIQLGENTFYGEIPQEVGYLFRLRILNLTINTLNGEIPVNLSRCSKLEYLNIRMNRLKGKIPTELSSLKKLVILNLALNNLTGGFPPSLGNLSSIQCISFAFNQLEGNLPLEMGLLNDLSFLNVGANYFTGKIPPSIYNVSALSMFSVAVNFLHGQLPANLGQSLPNLIQYYVAGNQFSGNIPISIANASELQVIDLSQNSLQGHVPNELGNLPNLQKFSVQSNLLGSNSTGDLSFFASLSNCSRLVSLTFTYNNFGGKLPNYVANLSSQLTTLWMGVNNIQGTIPDGLGSLTNLIALGLDSNSISGILPSDFGKFRNMQVLNLGYNRLSGQLPPSFCNISSLYALSLMQNRFEGNIPTCLGKFQQLLRLSFWENKFSGIISPQIFGPNFSPTELDLSHNSLSGSLPLQIGNLINIIDLDVSSNKFTGEIPITIGDCKVLESLAMQGNLFHGAIPQELTSLISIQHLDLSRNNLTGKIPRDLEKLSSLIYLNLSFNNLEGEIPTRGVFGNASQIILDGNSKICGGMPELKLPPCPIVHGKKKRKPLIAILLSTVFPLILISVTLACFYVIYKRRYKRKVSLNEPWGVNRGILRISYQDLHRATTGFSLENLIGSGNFGSVYKGKLDQHANRLVAVKVLDLRKIGASTSFKAECRALRNIRHRNLVSLLTYCSSIDFNGQDFKALVYEYMENGNLDARLHPAGTSEETSISRNMNLHQRLNIAIDVASALQYLHSHYDEAVVIHCDLKPSNILLDSNLTAHVGDFGLARLLPQTTEGTSEQGTRSTIGIKGSIGYAAPEYGMGSKASTQGDVYSYGILLLEMFTGRRPTDNTFVDSLDLHNYVKMNLPQCVLEIVDPLLVSQGEPMEPNDHSGIEQEVTERFENFEDCLILIFMIGLKCSATSSKDRMNMNEVTRELHQINDRFFGAQRLTRVSKKQENLKIPRK